MLSHCLFSVCTIHCMIPVYLTQLQSFLSSLLEPYEQEEDPNVTVGFNRTIELENGIYFNESFQDYDQVENLLTNVQQQQKVYTVQAGDTLWDIAQKNNLTMKELCALNPSFKGAPLSQDSSILPGDTLIITKEESLLEVRITKTVTWDEEIPNWYQPFPGLPVTYSCLPVLYVLMME